MQNLIDIFKTFLESMLFLYQLFFVNCFYSLFKFVIIIDIILWGMRCKKKFLNVL